MTLDLAYPVTETAFLPPHRCAVCSSGDGPYVDTRARFPGHIADNYNVYLCVGCARQIAEHTLGYGHTEALEARVAQLEEEIRQADLQLSGRT